MLLALMAMGSTFGGGEVESVVGTGAGSLTDAEVSCDAGADSSTAGGSVDWDVDAAVALALPLPFTFGCGGLRLRSKSCTQISSLVRRSTMIGKMRRTAPK